jgi:flagellar basal-body rod protein FlgC
MVGPISSPTDIALSGLKAAETQLNVAAENIANGGTVGAPPPASPPFGGSGVAAPALTGLQPSTVPNQVFQALQAVETPAPGGGVNVSVSRSPAFALAFQPDNPNADAQGLVATPNIDLATQAVNLLEARNNFEANLQVLKTSDQLEKRVLDLTT